MKQIILVLVYLMLSTNPYGWETDDAKSTPSLLNKWIFVCFQNVSTGIKDFPMDEKREVTIEFKSSDKMQGKGPCNYYHADFKTDNEGRLAITSMSSTERGCHMNIMEWERRYFNALRKADHYEIKNDELRIYFNDKTELIIYKIKKQIAP